MSTAFVITAAVGSLMLSHDNFSKRMKTMKVVSGISVSSSSYCVSSMEATTSSYTSLGCQVSLFSAQLVSIMLAKGADLTFDSKKVVELLDQLCMLYWSQHMNSHLGRFKTSICLLRRLVTTTSYSKTIANQ